MKKQPVFVRVMVIFMVTLWSCGLAYGGRIAAWGNNSDGQCNVPAGSDFVAVAAGEDYSVALKSDGSLVACGNNDDGQCDVPAGSDFTRIVATYRHTVALRSDGSLAAWGNNEWFQSDVPAGSNYIDIAAGAFHSIALKSNGSLVAWGANGMGQCNVPGGNDYVAVAAGWYHNVALKADGYIVAWGFNDLGQLNVPPGNDFIAVSAGWFHNVAIKADGSLVAWGHNSHGQSNVPTGDNFVQAAAGKFHSLTLDSDDSLAARGSNNQGQCNVPSGSEFVAVAAGRSHSLALVGVHFVDDDAPADPGPGNPDVSDPLEDGSQAHPFDAIQEGIDAAWHGDTVVVLDGTYTGQGNRDIDFAGKAITLRSTDSNDPDVVATTIIDCQGDPCEPHRGFSFVSGEGADSILDGLTITNGYAEDGGGIFCDLSSPTISKCMIKNNATTGWSEGGGIYCKRSNVTITNSIVSNNTTNGHGGGISCWRYSKPIIKDCNIFNNSAIHGGGGGIYSRRSEPQITNCKINNNMARYGAGIFGNHDDEKPTISNCIVSGNASDYNGGGGIQGCNGPITNCIITGNTGVYPGGGGLNRCNGPITNCIITNNSISNGDGGGVYRCKGPISNCLISGNSASDDGGGIDITACSNTITNCTIVGNSAAGYGGGLYAWFDSHVTISNCILWNNSGNGNEIALDYDQYGRPCTLTILYSDIKGGQDNTVIDSTCSLVWGVANIDSDPCFVNSLNDDYHLIAGSPCMDAGDNSVVDPNGTDLDGNPRIINGTVDMGAYEFQEPRTFYVDDDAPGDPGPGDPDVSDPLENGTAVHPFDTIQEAIDASAEGDMVIVEEGMYVENIVFNGTNIILYSTDPEDAGVVENTVIDGGGFDSVVTFNGSENASCVLSGFTITNGYASGKGGGVSGNNTIATISNCVVSDNTDENGGGGFRFCDGRISNCVISNNIGGGGGGLFYCDALITDCIISNNTTNGGAGGGLCGCRGEIINCVISDNAGKDGGGLWNCDAPITNCVISGNTAERYGGGLKGCIKPITNCIISNNSAGRHGGGLSTCGGTISNCTIIYNTAGGDGGGIQNYDSRGITNCIIFGNSAGEGDDDVVSWTMPTYSCFSGAIGNGNIDVDPLFHDPENGNFRLSAGSPCIDAGDNSVVEPNSTDLDGNPRIINGIVDMGAYEAPVSIEADVHIVPRVISRSNRMKRIIAIMRLPDGISKRDVADEPFMLYPDDNTADSIEAIWQRVVGWGGKASVFALFDKAQLMDAVEHNGRVELTVVGKLTSGQYIYGSDTVRVVKPRRRRPRWRHRR